MAQHEFIVAAGLVSTVGVVGDFEAALDEDGESSVVAVRFVPQAAQAAQGATNFATLTLRNFTRNPATPRVVATLNLGTAALTAEVETDFVLSTTTDPSTGSGPIPYAHVNAGDVFDLFATQAGTGGTWPAGRILVETQ